MNISSRNYSNHNERDIITAGSDNHVEGIEFLLRLNPSNKYRFEAFEAALKAQNWASVAVFVKRGVLHGPQSISKTIYGMLNGKWDYFEQIVNSILESTKASEMTAESLQGFRTLLFELAKLDTSLKSEYFPRGSDGIQSLCKFRADLALTHKYFYLFGAVGFAFARPILSEEIAIHLIRFHFMSTVHGINRHADGIVLQTPQGKRLIEGAQEYLQQFLDAVSSNKDGCRDLFYEALFRLAYGVSGENLTESVKSELYSRQKFVQRVFKDQDCKVFTFEIVGDDADDKKKPDHTQYVENGSMVNLFSSANKSSGFVRL